MRMRGGSGRAILFIAVLVAALAPRGAEAATVVNGGFESGTLDGWHVHRATEAGNWFAYKGTDAPIGSKRPHPADPVQPPPQGVYAATSDEANPDTLILYQDIALEAGYNHQLSLLVYYDSYKPISVPTPDTLSVDEESLAGRKNQQYRIDVMKPDAPLESVDPADILRTLFVTKPGDPQKLAPTRLTANLSAFAGQTVRLRIANAVHEEVFNAGVDAVSISSALPGSSSRGSRNGPSLFSFGKVRTNRRNGTATLRVRVSGPGLLRAKGASTAADTARPRKAGELGNTIEPITIPVAVARTVRIHLRPTPSARAVLVRKHKLRVRVGVTYMPTSGALETASLPVVFKLTGHSNRPR
jgi:hypothetical protein